MSLERFTQTMYQGASQASIGFNTHWLKGVKGMPTTHQIGFGRTIRHGLDPNSINIQKMEREVHGSMVFAGISAVATPLLIKQEPLFSILTGILAASEMRQLYLDWMTGFQAEELMGDWYWEKLEEHGPAAYYQQMF